MFKSASISSSFPWCQTVVQFPSFARDCPVFPTPFIEETVLSPLYILGSSVVNELTTYAWVYFWALASGPLTSCYFLPASGCLDDYGLVAWFVSGSVMSPALFFSLGSALGGLFVVPYKVEDCLS